MRQYVRLERDRQATIALDGAYENVRIILRLEKERNKELVFVVDDEGFRGRRRRRKRSLMMMIRRKRRVLILMLFASRFVMRLCVGGGGSRGSKARDCANSANSRC